MQTEVDLGCHSELDCLLLRDSTAVFFRSLASRLFSAHPLKEQVAEYTSRFALKGSPPL